MKTGLVIYKAGKWAKNLFVDTKASREFMASGGEEGFLERDYDLNKDSIVVDVGGYLGGFPSQIFSKFLCKVYTFEPIEENLEKLRERFSRNPSITIIPKALGGAAGKQPMGVFAGGSSFFVAPNKTTREVEITDFVEEMKTLGIQKIDLINMNAEGSEYGLMDRIIDSGFIKNIRFLQIQFHDFYPNAKEEHHRIQEKLRRTHNLRWNYDFVLESWEIKNR